MDEYWLAFLAAMDDTDVNLVSAAYIIVESQMSIEEKTKALWDLFKHRK
jgi:hypothetical protein